MLEIIDNDDINSNLYIAFNSSIAITDDNFIYTLYRANIKNNALDYLYKKYPDTFNKRKILRYPCNSLNLIKMVKDKKKNTDRFYVINCTVELDNNYIDYYINDPDINNGEKVSYKHVYPFIKTIIDRYVFFDKYKETINNILRCRSNYHHNNKNNLIIIEEENFKHMSYYIKNFNNKIFESYNSTYKHYSNKSIFDLGMLQIKNNKNIYYVNDKINLSFNMSSKLVNLTIGNLYIKTDYIFQFIHSVKGLYNKILHGIQKQLIEEI